MNILNQTQQKSNSKRQTTSKSNGGFFNSLKYKGRNTSSSRTLNRQLILVFLSARGISAFISGGHT